MSEFRSKYHRQILNIVCVLFSVHFAIAYNTLTLAMVPFSPYRELTGEGGPFAYRMLPALMWKVAVRLLSPLHQRLPRLHLPSLGVPFSNNEQWFVVLLTFAAMLGTLSIARSLMRAIDPRWGFEWLALAMAYMAYFDTMLVLNRNLYYPYDLTGLFLFTLLVYLAYRGRPAVFTLVLAVAILNKETAAMAVLIYFGVQYGRRPLRNLVLWCSGMGAVVLAVRIGEYAYIHHICAACHGVVQNQFAYNVRQLVNPLFWASELSVFGFAYFALFFFWEYVPRRIRTTAVVVYATWLLAMTVTGILREVRIFSELSALLLLVVALGVHGWLQQNKPAAQLA